MTTVVPLAHLRQANAPAIEHAPILRVDLGAIRSNYLEVRRRYRGRVLSAVVKSDAYGLGLEPVASALVSAGCRVFWVNDLAEASRLRSTAPQAEVYTLMGIGRHHARDFEAIGVTPALVGLDEVEHCARHALVTGRRLPVAMQIDTGLGRLGLGDEELAFLERRPDILDRLDIRLWVSHLAAYNLPDDPANTEQRRKLSYWAFRLPAAPVSLAASSGVLSNLHGDRGGGGAAGGAGVSQSAAASG